MNRRKFLSVIINSTAAILLAGTTLLGQDKRTKVKLEQEKQTYYSIHIDELISKCKKVV